jgi:TDG/mug DNA glycosylase family protein
MPLEGEPWRLTQEQLSAARGKRVRMSSDGSSPALRRNQSRPLCGRRGSPFRPTRKALWKALQAGGFTQRELSPFEERDLLAEGIGISNVVARATASASELSPDELRQGAKALKRKVQRCRPRVVAFLGIGAFRIAFARQDAMLGQQPETLAGALVWVLPNPSGINANYQLPVLAGQFRALRRSVEANSPRHSSVRKAKDRLG